MIFDELLWNYNLKKVKKYINKNNSKPSRKSKDITIKKLGKWFFNQNIYYKNKKNKIMNNEHIRIKWENFINEYFLTSDEIWNNNLNKVKLYIKNYNCKPSRYNKDKDIKKLGLWIINQQKKYKNNIIDSFLHTDLQKNNNINKWEQFINEYSDYFLNNDELWNNNLEKVKNYIKENKCRPSNSNKDNNIKSLGIWMSNQHIHYKNNKFIMKNNNIKIKGEEFINEYKEYFLSNEELLNNKLEQVISYIKENNHKPSINSKGKKLNFWIYTQQKNYKSNKFIMKNNNIRIIWEEFIKKYKII